MSVDPLADLLDRAGGVFSMAGELGRAFHEQGQSRAVFTDRSIWQQHAPAFERYYNALLELRSAMQNPPDGFASVAVVLQNAAKTARRIRSTIEREGRFTEYLEFVPDLNTVFQSGWQAVKQVTTIHRLDDPFAFVDEPATASAVPVNEMAFLEQVRDEVHNVAEAKRDRGYENDTLVSMVRGINWSEASAKLASIPGVTELVRRKLMNIFRRDLTVGALEQIDALLTPAIWELRDSLQQSGDKMSESPAEVLISWSKPKSRKVASAIYDWLKTVLPGVNPWMSDKDIDKGKEWFQELQSLLANAKLCIVCVTEENVRSPWLYYETGAIATKGGDVRVCPYLVGVRPSILSDGPLGKFQCTESTRDDTLALIKSLNKVLSAPHNPDLLAGNFASKWPTLESTLQTIEAEKPHDQVTFTRTEADDLAGVILSSEARMMLIEASKTNGRVTRTDTMAGTSFSAGNTDLDGEGDPRKEALWNHALGVLLDSKLLEAVGHEGSLFKLTARGYKVADKLNSKP